MCAATPPNQTGLEQICPDSPEWYAQMAAFPLPAGDAAALCRRRGVSMAPWWGSSRRT